MSTKKPRESRKPLDQNFQENPEFRDFVHGNSSEDLGKSLSAASEPATTDLATLQQAFLGLQQRLDRLEQGSTQPEPIDSPLFADLEQQIDQSIQRLEKLEKQLPAQMTDLEGRIAEFEHAPSAIEQIRQFETQLHHLTHQLDTMNASPTSVVSIAPLQERLDLLERTLADRWEREIQYFTQINTQLTTLSQQVEQLGQEFRHLKAEVQHLSQPTHTPMIAATSDAQIRVSSPPSIEPAVAAAELMPPVVDNHQTAPSPMEDNSHAAIVEPLPRRSSPDALLNRLASLLDDF
jgi:DNA repair exonuclease SbcCD ATPase subunit